MVVFVLVPVACTLIFMTAWVLHRRVVKKPLPDSQSGISDEENILLDKSENVQGMSKQLVNEIVSIDPDWLDAISTEKSQGTGHKCGWPIS